MCLQEKVAYPIIVVDIRPIRYEHLNIRKEEIQQGSQIQTQIQSVPKEHVHSRHRFQRTGLSV